MAEIQKEEVEIPVLGHLVGREFNIMWQHLIFLHFIYIVQMRKGDCTSLRKYDGCRAVALPSADQIVVNYRSKSSTLFQIVLISV